MNNWEVVYESMPGTKEKIVVQAANYNAAIKRVERLAIEQSRMIEIISAKRIA